MMAINNKGYLDSTSATMHTMHFIDNFFYNFIDNFFYVQKQMTLQIIFYFFFYVQKQMTLQKQEEELQKEKNLKQEWLLAF